MLRSECTIEGTDVHVAVWQIVEDEEELLSLLAVMQTKDAFATMQTRLETLHNPSRRCEWLAVRMLVARCLGGDKVVSYDADGRPSLTDHSFEISISHTKGYAALAWHPSKAVGVDIERRTDRVMRVVSRYVNADEKAFLQSSCFSSPDGELLLWTAKEALYKTVGIRLLDCQNQLTVNVPMSPTSFDWLKTTAYCSANAQEYDVLCSFNIVEDCVLSFCLPSAQEESRD